MQTKLAKNIQMILVTLFVILVGAIIVGVLSCNNVIAYSEGERCSVCLATTLRWDYDSKVHGYYCDYCQDWYGESSHNNKAVDFIKTEFYMSHTTYYVCTECDYKTEKTEECKLVNFKKIDEEKHEAQCKECQDKYELPHVDNDNNGICDDCSFNMRNSTNDEHVCLDNSEYSSKGSQGHSATCKICGYEVIFEHEGANHENGGKCTVKGCGYQYETHVKTTTLTGDYTDITETTHTPIYKCSHGGCTETFKGNAENHEYKNGKCECGQEKIEEVLEIEITSKEYELNNIYISNVQPAVTVSEFKTKIETNGTYIKIYNKDNQLVSDSAKIGTGMKIKIENGDTTKSFTIIVNGDVNGDGEADFKDIVKINQVRLDKNNFEEEYFLAADVTGDGKVDFKDISKINRFRLDKIAEL